MNAACRSSTVPCRSDAPAVTIAGGTSRSPALAVEPDRQAFQLVEEAGLEVDGRPRHHHPRVPREGLLEQDLQLQPRQSRAEAEVPPAGAERLVVGVAEDVEAVGVLVTGLVAVGGRVPHDHLVALLDLL